MTQYDFSLLKDRGYKFYCRGTMPIKGKGDMTTHFLIGNQKREIPFEAPEKKPASPVITKGK